MAKYYGKIGFGVTVETSPGVMKPDIVERPYKGDVLRNTRRWQNGEGANDNLNINNSISILADPYAFENFHNIRYASWMGVNWKISNIDVQYPRLILTLGGEYNG